MPVYRIKTKYKEGQKVFFLTNFQQLGCGTIRKVHPEPKDPIDDPDVEGDFVIYYELGDPTRKLPLMPRFDRNNTIPESRLFGSKAALYKHLEENISDYDKSEGK